jgi:DNA-binding response OmpR family regulator
MESPLILVIDDSLTIRKLVECHLSQAGYRVALAPDADQGVAAAESLRPDLILLDHQLPGTTGDEVCRRLLASETSARIPVVISSAMRNRAFAAYTDFPNVVDQIPKPFTPELLRSGVANALQMGSMVVQAQRTGCAMPEAVGEVHSAVLEGDTSALPLRTLLDMLNNSELAGCLTLEQGRDRIRFALGGGRIQAVFSQTVDPDRIAEAVPGELEDLVPLLGVTLGERHDATMSGLIKMLERSLSDPRRLRALLRVQAAALAHMALSGGPGKFSFELDRALPPVFQAFPLQLSLVALVVEGVRRRDPAADDGSWSDRIYARRSHRGANLDRAGLAPAELKALALLDGSLDMAEVAQRSGLELTEAVDLIRGLEIVGLVERRGAEAASSILLFDEDPEEVKMVTSVLGPAGLGCVVKAVRDRVGAQLLLRRGSFDLMLLDLDRPDQEAFVRSWREQAPATTRLVGLVGLSDEAEIERVDGLGLDGVLTRPLSEGDLRAAVRHLLGMREERGVAVG